MSGETATAARPTFTSKRRWVRYKLDVPVRAVIQKLDKTVIRDGRGTELSEGGMCLMAGVELGEGDEIHVEFTPPYSSPIRVRGKVCNRKGYRYGVEFSAKNASEEADVAQLLEILRLLSGEKVLPS
jgi:hypothetical protein